MTDLPITTILGVRNPANPFDVLGLPIGPITEADVIDALGERMHQVAMHPLSETPEGNEVRLALHERAGVIAAARSAPVARRAPETLLGPRALLVIASEGGWNQRAMRRLALLAHAEGIPSSAVPRVVRDLAGEHRVGPVSADGAPPERRGQIPRHSPSESADGDTLQNMLTAAAVAAAIVVLAITWIALDARVGTEPSPAPVAEAGPPRDAGPQTAETIDPSTVESPKPVPAERGVADADLDTPDWASALIGMRDARVPSDVETVARVLDGVAESWASRSQTDLQRIGSAFVDVVYLLPPDDGASLVAAMADRIRVDRPSMVSFHAGLLSRLSVERSLSTPVDNAIVASLVSTIGAQPRPGDDLFAQGAGRGLSFLASSWAGAPPGQEALGDWTACADAVRAIEPQIEARIVREALESVLRSDRDVLADAALLRVTETLAGRLDPMRDAEASGLVLRLLADQAVSTRSASVLVNAIARSGSAGDPSAPIRLAPAASQSERADVRTRLAESWLRHVDPAEGIEELRAAIAGHFKADVPSTPTGQLADAVVSARLSNACQLMLWGAPDQAAAIVSALRVDLDRIVAQGSAGVSTDANASDAWAIRYLEAKRNIPVRLSLLGELVQRRNQLGMIAAELVVAEAVNGSPASVRREAQNVVMLSADQPTVINAFLEILPTVPRVGSVQEMVERVAAKSMPSIDGPSWPYEARRAMVDRLLEAEGGTNEARTIDALSGLLAEEHARRLSATASVTQPVEDSLNRLIAERLDEIRRIDLSGAASAEVEDTMRQLSGRLTLAEGAVSRFAALQVSAVELLAALVGLESPHLRDRARQVLTDLSGARLDARSAFGQIAATERAGLELWALRIGVAP